MKNFDIFNIVVENIDCGYTLEPPTKYPQSMFWIKNKNSRFTPVYPNVSI